MNPIASIAMFEYRSQVPPSPVWSALVHSCATSSIECAMAYYGFYEILSSIDQSISEACSPGACCALDTP